MRTLAARRGARGESPALEGRAACAEPRARREARVGTVTDLHREEGGSLCRRCCCGAAGVVPRLAPTDTTGGVYRGVQDPGRHLAGRAGGVRPGARSKAAADGAYSKGKANSRNDKRKC